MSWHLSHRLTTVNRAVSMALLYSVGYAALSSSAQAATIGKTVITSAQHEPLAASIAVTDIKAADFSANIATSDVYQRMGLTPTASMNVRFEPTSATTGQLFITTSQPVSKPFADVVLAINDGKERNLVPKTLLMPLGDDNAQAQSKPSNKVVSAAQKPNLPSISANNAMPLTIRQGTPPPLLSAPKSTTAMTSTTSAATQAGNLVTAPNNSNTMLDNDSGNTNSTLSTGATDKQFDILNIQVMRQIQPSNGVTNNTTNNSVMAPSNTVASAAENNTKPMFEPLSSVPPAPESKAKPMFELLPDQPNTASNNTASNNSTTAKQATPSANTSATANYTVQRNDNLWTISQQIAQQNNLDVQTVMAQIQSQNPDAFINKDANQLKANTKLDLTEYEVVPSQQSLQAAISAQRQSFQQANKQQSKKNDKPVTKKPAATPVANTQAKSAKSATKDSKRTEQSATTTTQTLPKARFSVIAPGRDGRADGTQTKAAAATGNGLSTDILATLKSTRQSTAAQAQRLSKTNNALGSYTKKLQLQNQKLAELQARLKKLRNQ